MAAKAAIAFILDHSETKVLLVDREFHRVVTEALAIAKVQPRIGTDLASSFLRAWADARVQRVYGGTTEIMKEIIGKSLGV